MGQLFKCLCNVRSGVNCPSFEQPEKKYFSFEIWLLDKVIQKEGYSFSPWCV